MRNPGRLIWQTNSAPDVDGKYRRAGVSAEPAARPCPQGPRRPNPSLRPDLSRQLHPASGAARLSFPASASAASAGLPPVNPCQSPHLRLPSKRRSCQHPLWHSNLLSSPRRRSNPHPRSSRQFRSVPTAERPSRPAGASARSAAIASKSPSKQCRSRPFPRSQHHPPQLKPRRSSLRPRRLPSRQSSSPRPSALRRLLRKTRLPCRPSQRQKSRMFSSMRPRNRNRFVSLPRCGLKNRRFLPQPRARTSRLRQNPRVRKNRLLRPKLRRPLFPLLRHCQKHRPHSSPRPRLPCRGSNPGRPSPSRSALPRLCWRPQAPAGNGMPISIASSPPRQTHRPHRSRPHR
jgi:hypothetical protein